jgi:hypothetical protein
MERQWRSGPPVDLTRTGGGALLYLHIPKAAGTSVRKALGRAYDRRERAYVYNSRSVWGAVTAARLADLPEEQRRRLRLVFGHFHYGIHEVIPRPAAYVAVLRHPLERVISLYHHRRRDSRKHRLLDPRRFRAGRPAQLERELFRRYGATIEEWVFERRALEVDNGMVRLIAARPRVPFGQCPDDLLAEALEHVDRHFAALLVQEDMAASVGVLERLVGRPLSRLGQDNVNRARPPIADVDPNVRDRIAELNRLDTRLYEIALERFDRMVASREVSPAVRGGTMVSSGQDATTSD